MKKVRIKKLSAKIILTLIGILFVLSFVSLILERILWACGVITATKQTNNWVMRLAVPVVGTVIIVVFAYVLNKLIVARVRKLNDATNEVVKGNYNVLLDVKGSDELSKLTESFNTMTSELKANEYLSKDFIKNISHEFKTPISAIKAYAELIETESNKKSLKEYSKIIMEESDRLAALSKSILQLSLLDSTTLIKKEDNFNPSEQISGILRLVHDKWESKNIELDLQLESFSITNNEQLLNQVWQNLISNAIKFSNKKGVIKILLKKGIEGFCFEITDNGVGIKDEDKEKIFTHFFMADKSRNSEGSGLGLPIVKKIIDKLGGTINFESKEGEGTTFKVELNF